MYSFKRTGYAVTVHCLVTLLLGLVDEWLAGIYVVVITALFVVLEEPWFGRKKK